MQFRSPDVRQAENRLPILLQIRASPDLPFWGEVDLTFRSTEILWARQSQSYNRSGPSYFAETCARRATKHCKAQNPSENYYCIDVQSENLAKSTVKNLVHGNPSLLRLARLRMSANSLLETYWWAVGVASVAFPMSYLIAPLCGAKFIIYRHCWLKR